MCWWYGLVETRNSYLDLMAMWQCFLRWIRPRRLRTDLEQGLMGDRCRALVLSEKVEPLLPCARIVILEG